MPDRLPPINTEADRGERFPEVVRDEIDAVVGALLEDVASTAYEAAVQLYAGVAITPPIQFGAATAVPGVSGTNRAWVKRTLTQARMRVASAPSGSSLIAEVQSYADGVGWTTAATLTIANGSIIEAVANIDVDQAVEDLVRINVTSVGSVAAATGMVVDVHWRLDP